MLKSALLVRATADVKRIWRIKEDKQALAGLHQRGLVGDDTMARFAAAEKELEAEIVDVVSEANTFRNGWGAMIFATASEMANAERTRETVINIGKVKAQEGESTWRRAASAASTARTSDRPRSDLLHHTPPTKLTTQRNASSSAPNSSVFLLRRPTSPRPLLPARLPARRLPAPSRLKSPPRSRPRRRRRPPASPSLPSSSTCSSRWA